MKRAIKNKINAVILAAGFGMRLIPINNKMPKGLLVVNGQPLIEQLIEQLQESGVNDIYVVVGFMKEAFYYLQDKYNVHLIENDQYAVKNNLHSLKLVVEHIKNTYIVPSDVWCKENPFSSLEVDSWYMVSNSVDNDSCVRIDRRNNLVRIPYRYGGNSMLGICYLNSDDAQVVRKRIGELTKDSFYDNKFWEIALYRGDNFLVHGKCVSCADYVEINTYEDLRELDSNSEQLKSRVINALCDALGAGLEDIYGIRGLKKGMTNRSFMFSYEGHKYIMRIPGEGTDQLINRAQEAAVYEQIKEKELCDKIVYINSKNGYKITSFIENSRNCDSANVKDLKLCMNKLREFHAMKLQVEHEFDVFEHIDFYESLWDGNKSSFKDYEKTKANIYSLKAYIEEQDIERCLTHIDAVPDNFLLYKDEYGKDQVRLIDWEYAAIQDPHIDIAMFCIYSLYNKRQIDRLINIYFENSCPVAIRVKIYCYIAVCGLLWSNWCEYKRMLGIDFDDYALRQYKYAKDYYRIAKREIERMGANA